MSSIRGFTVTAEGRRLFARLAAARRPVKFSRVLFGTGRLPAGSTEEALQNRTELLEPFAEGTSTTPIYENDTVSMVLEFRSDMNGGLSRTVWLNEFGVYAEDLDGTDVLALYGNLGDYAESVPAMGDGPPTTRDYPISVRLGAAARVELDFSASAFLTSQEADDLLQACLRRSVKMTTVPVTIPPSAWGPSPNGGYFLYAARVEIEAVTAEHYPDVTLDAECVGAAFEYGLCPTVDSMDGALVFYAQERPSDYFTGTCRLLKKGMEPYTGADEAVTPTEASCRHYVIAVRTRDPHRPDFGLDKDKVIATLAVGPYTEAARVGALVSGVLFSAENISESAINAPNGTLIIKQMEG